MGIRHGHQLHVRITEQCDHELERIARAEATIKSDLVRQVLWNFVRDYTAAAAAGSLESAKQTSVAHLVLGRHRIR